jgi:hypothetical protein
VAPSTPPRGSTTLGEKRRGRAFRDRGAGSQEQYLQCAAMELRPFRSIRFAPRVLHERGLSDVFAPPYDQISPALRDRLYAKAPENIVRITSRKDDGSDVYAAPRRR